MRGAQFESWLLKAKCPGILAVLMAAIVIGCGGGSSQATSGTSDGGSTGSATGLTTGLTTGITSGSTTGSSAIANKTGLNTYFTENQLVNSNDASQLMATVNIFGAGLFPYVRVPVKFDVASLGTWDSTANAFPYESIQAQNYLALISSLTNQGYRPLLVFQTDRTETNFATSDPYGGWPTDPTWQSRFIHWITQFLQYQSSHGQNVSQLGIQIGNEINLSPYFAANQSYFATDFVQAVQAIKSLGLNPQIVTPGYSNTTLTVTTASKWLSYLTNSGIMGVCDTVALHPYLATDPNLPPVPEDSLSDIQLFRSQSTAQGKKLYITEVGTHTLQQVFHGNTYFTATQQDSIIFRDLLISLIGGADAVILYEARDRSDWCNGSSDTGCQPVAGGEAYFGLEYSDRRLKASGTDLKNFLTSFGSYSLLPNTFAQVAGSSDFYQVTLQNGAGVQAVVSWSKNQNNVTPQYSYVPSVMTRTTRKNSSKILR